MIHLTEITYRLSRAFVLGISWIALAASCARGPDNRAQQREGTGASTERGRSAVAPTVTIFKLLSHPILDQSVEGIRAGLASAGYAGERVRIIEINANGETDKLNAFAQEVISSKPTLVIPVSTPVALAVSSQAPPGQDVLYSTVTNPADIGMDAKPANMTGVSDAVNYQANLELIRSLIPRARRVGVIYNASERNSQFGVNEVKRLAPPLGLTVRLLAVARSDEVVSAVRALAAQIDVLYIGSDNTVVSALPGLLKAAQERRIPVVASDQGSVEQGAIAAVSVDYKRLGERAGKLAAEILRTGRRPGTFEPVRYVGDRLILNSKAAAAAGLTLTDSLRRQAAQVF